MGWKDEKFSQETDKLYWEAKEAVWNLVVYCDDCTDEQIDQLNNYLFQFDNNQRNTVENSKDEKYAAIKKFIYIEYLFKNWFADIAKIKPTKLIKWAMSRKTISVPRMMIDWINGQDSKQEANSAPVGSNHTDKEPDTDNVKNDDCNPESAQDNLLQVEDEQSQQVTDLYKSFFDICPICYEMFKLYRDGATKEEIATAMRKVNEVHMSFYTVFPILYEIFQLYCAGLNRNDIAIVLQKENKATIAQAMWLGSVDITFVSAI